MLQSLLFVTALLFCLSVSDAHAFQTKGQNCLKCHVLMKDEAAALLKNFDSGIKILNIGQSRVKYLWEVSYESKGKKGLLYIDLPKKHVFSGSLIALQGKRNLTKERLSEINRVNVSQIPLKNSLVLGDSTAKKRVIVFNDPDCPFCAKLHREMKRVVEDRKDIAFFIKMFPLKMHPGAYDKAKTIVCEHSLELLESAFEQKKLPAPKCKTSAVDDTIKLAEKLGITGTPTMILPDGRVISGFLDGKNLKEQIDRK